MAVSIENIQPDIYYKLQSEALFAPICVFQQRLERVSSLIAEDLSKTTQDATQQGKKAGASITVCYPKLSVQKAEAPGPLCEVEVVFNVKENPTWNMGAFEQGSQYGTGVTCEQWCQNILQVMHLFYIDGLAQAFYANPKGSMRPNREYEKWNLISYDVSILATFPLSVLQQCSPATPSVDSNFNVAFTPTLVGSTTYYTTDGSFPGSGNPSAQVYQNPFASSNGANIRWASYYTGLVGSDALAMEITN